LDKSSLEGVTELHKLVISRYPDRKFSWILVGCDSEKESERKVTFEEAKAVARSLYSPEETGVYTDSYTDVIECSAATGEKCDGAVPRVVLDWKFRNPDHHKQPGCIVS
jgi:hypothetical protein